MHHTVALAFACLVAWMVPAQAAYDRHSIDGQWSGPEITGPGKTRQRHAKHQRHDYRHKHVQLRGRAGYRAPKLSVGKVAVRPQIVAHPAGCPRSLFCGCGVALRVFGHHVRNLWLAANWRRFPAASPAPGRVAWRYGHVFYIEKVIGHGRVLAYDPNSGRRLTRIHVRSLAGYRVVDPRRG